MKAKNMAIVIVMLCFAASMNGYAAEQKTAGKGNVIGMVQFFSQDIWYLEREINNLMSECGKELSR